MAFDRNAAEDQSYGHKPVLLDECLDALAIKPDGVYLDGTLGRAGHSLEIARRLNKHGRLIGVDRDETALQAAQQRLGEYMDRVSLVHSNFSQIHDILDNLGIDKIESGKVYVHGKKVKYRVFADAIKDGLGLIPEDRKLQGLIQAMSIKKNTSLVNLDGIIRNGFIDYKLEAKIAKEYADKLGLAFRLRINGQTVL